MADDEGYTDFPDVYTSRTRPASGADIAAAKAMDHSRPMAVAAPPTVRPDGQRFPAPTPQAVSAKPAPPPRPAPAPPASPAATPPAPAAADSVEEGENASGRGGRHRRRRQRSNRSDLV